LAEDEVLLQCSGLKKYYPVRGGTFSTTNAVVHAVDGVDLYIKKNESVGLVGESGSGKTTTGLLVLRLVEPTGGKVIFDGKDIFSLSKKVVRKTRKDMQPVFQDSQDVFNPHMTVGGLISEPMRIYGHDDASGTSVNDRLLELLKDVGLGPEHLNKYAHQLSGGQRQRVGLARALALHPKLIVLDEPTSSVDVSVQAKILNLLNDLKSRYGLSYLFITHDLNIVRNMCDRTAVMYLGRVVESAPTDELFSSPLHPYTQALLSSVPNPNPRKHNLTDKETIAGEIPSQVNLPVGCRFNTRCPHVMDRCRQIEPELVRVSKDHYVACYLVDEGKEGA
jgi:peptide/nickel transport system ATP-binding protein